MHVLVTCQNAECHKSFKVESPGKPSDFVNIPNEPQDTECPHCNVVNQITWPKGVRFNVTPDS